MASNDKDSKRAIMALKSLTDGLQFRFNVKGIVVPNNQYDVFYRLETDSDKNLQFSLLPMKSSTTMYGRFKEEKLNAILRNIQDIYKINIVHDGNYDARMALLNGINDIESNTHELRVYHSNIKSIQPSFNDNGKLYEIIINTTDGAEVGMFDFKEQVFYTDRMKGDME